MTVLNTPFTNNDSIDETNLRKNVKVALKAGINGFLVPTMVSEVKKMSLKERLEIVNIVLDEVNNGVSVIAGEGDKESNKSREIIRSYIKAGCENVLFQLPYEDKKIFYEG